MQSEESRAALAAFQVKINELSNEITVLTTIKTVLRQLVNILRENAVASIHSVGGTPEYDTGIEMQRFMIQTNLANIKPDLRHYGFNHPDGADHGYERWVTIPNNIEVQKPFVKKYFPGGLCAAHMIPMGNFEEWAWLSEWGKNSSEYDIT